MDTLTTALAEGEMIEGVDPVSMMTMLRDSADLFAGVGGALKENRSDLDTIFTNLRTTSENLKELSEDVKAHPWKLIRKSDSKKKKWLFF
jgi:hypothetical protein